MRCKTGLFSRYVPFSPTSIDGLTGWWDASDSSTLFDATSGGSAVAADGSVARLEDKSGSGRHFAQSTTDSRPLRKTAIQNGLDVLRFDGSDDFFQSSGFSFSDICSSSACAFFAVAQISSASSSHAFYGANPTLVVESNGDQGFASFRSTGEIDTFGYDFSFRAATASYSGGWKVFSATHSSGTLSQRLNSESAGSTSLGTRNFFSGQVQVARGASGSPGIYSRTYLECDIGEIIVYNVALSATDRDAVETYLLDKWAIT